MTSRDFVYWLQGFFELSESAQLTEKQTELIKNHLSMVFLHDIDPSAGPPDVQELLNKLHEGQGNAAPKPVPNAHSGGSGPTVYRC